MLTRALGTGGLAVSALGLGCMGLSYGLGAGVGTAEGVTLIRAALAGVAVEGQRHPQAMAEMAGR